MNQEQGVASFHIKRVLGCVGVALSLACGSAPAFAQAADRCVAPLTSAAEVPDPEAFWNSDRTIFAWSRKGDERTTYRIVGDIVELTPQLFPALATEPGQPLDGVAEISVEAREIILSMPIRLKDGIIRLRADQVRFTGSGSLSLTDPPEKQPQLVEIVADTLDLSRAPAMPFVLQTQGWELNGPPQWPTPATATRMLRAKVREIVPESGATEASKKQLKDDPLRWIHNRTADQGFDSGFPKSQWSAGYDVAVGGSANDYDDLFGSTLLWPDVTVGKLARLRALAPFDPAVDAFIRAKLDELTPRLARRSSRYALSALNLMREQMDLGLDPFGYGPNEVPMTSLPARLKAFQKSLGGTFGANKKAGSLALWDEARLAALATGQATGAARQVDQVDRMLRLASADRAAAAQRVAAHTARLLKALGEGQAKITESISIQEQLLAQYDSEKEQAQSFNRIVDDLLVDSMVIGMGRPAAAPYALRPDPAATSPVSFYGDIEGEPPPSPPASLGEISDRYLAFATLAGDFNAAWTAVDPHVAPALGHLTGKQKNEAELDAFKTAMKAAFEKAQALDAALTVGPAEFMLEFNDYSAVDPERNAQWLSLLKEAEAAMAGIGSLQAMIEADMRRLRAIDADIGWLGAFRDDLLALKSMPKEAAAERQAMLTIGMRARLLTEIAREATALRTGFFYALGQNVALSEAIAGAGDALASQGLDLRHPELHDPAQMQVSLEAERAQLNQYYDSFATGLAERTAGFSEKKPAAPFTVEFFRAAYQDDLGQDLEGAYHRSRFLDSLNRSIAAQIELGKAGAGFASSPVLIPIAITPPGPSDGPQFLLGVAVTKVRFQDAPKVQGAINLTVEHPRWGNIQIDGTCHRVVDAADSPDGIETGYSKTISLTRDVDENWNKAVAADRAFAKILDNAFPIDAPYYAYVEIPQPGAWSKPPVIDEIEILLVRTGTGLQ